MRKSFEDRNQLDACRVNHHLSGMLEIDRNLAADIGLHLAQAPIGLVGMAHQHAGFKDGIDRHGGSFQHEGWT